MKKALNLEKITIENFKSWKNLSLDIQNFNLLAGLNGSGKTNIFRAIQSVLQRSYSLGTSTFWSTIASNDCYAIERDDILIRLDFKEGFISSKFVFNQKNKNIHSPIYREDDIDLLEWKIYKDDKKLIVNGEKYAIVDPTIAAFYFQGTGELFDLLTNSIKFIYPSIALKHIFYVPDKLLQALEKDDKEQLEILEKEFRKENVMTGIIDEDIFAILRLYIDDILKENFLSRFNKIFEYTKIDEFRLERLSARENNPKAYIYCQEDINGRKIKIPFSELPDGAKVFFKIFFNIFSALPNSTILIEEPENHLHLEVIYNLTDLIIEYAEKHNLKFIISTHSPEIVNGFSPTDIIKIHRADEGYSFLHRITDQESKNEIIEYLAGMPV